MKIITVTLNPAVDKTLYVSNFQLGKVNRIEKRFSFASGKGVNVSKVLHVLGTKSLALGFVGGKNGKFVIDQLNLQGIENDFVKVQGNTRENIKIIEKDTIRNTDVNEEGPKVLSSHLTQFRDKLKNHVVENDIVVFSGSAPPGAGKNIYSELIKLCKSKGAYCCLDASGDYLLRGISAQPDLIKPNAVELIQLAEKSGSSISDSFSIPDVVKIISEILDSGQREVFSSLGEKGAVYMSNHAKYRLFPLSVNVLDATGAGDALLAGFVHGLIKGCPLEHRLKYAVTCAAASIMSKGCKPSSRTQIEELFKKVQMEKIS